MRDFEGFIHNFRGFIAGYDFYVDFEKVYQKTEGIKIELNILNSLLGSPDIEDAFENLILSYPQVLRCIPILLAKREMEIHVHDPHAGPLSFHFDKADMSLAQYKVFMRETGLFDLMQRRLVNPRGLCNRGRSRHEYQRTEEQGWGRYGEHR